MADLKIELNSVIEIVNKDNTYKGTVQDVNEREFGIPLIHEGGDYVLFEIGSKLEIRFFDGMTIYSINTVVTRRSGEEGIPMYYFDIPKEFEKIQRREFVRAFVSEEIYFYKADPAPEGGRQNLLAETIGREKNIAILLDLSGGGIRFLSPVVLEKDENIIVDIDVNGDQVLAEATITWCEKDNHNRIICGAKFIYMHEFQRDKIINKVFQVMRRQQRNL